MPQDFLNIQRRTGLYSNIPIDKITDIADAPGADNADGTIQAAGSIIYLNDGTMVQTQYAASDIMDYLVTSGAAVKFTFTPPQQP